MKAFLSVLGWAVAALLATISFTAFAQTIPPSPPSLPTSGPQPHPSAPDGTRPLVPQPVTPPHPGPNAPPVIPQSVSPIDVQQVKPPNQVTLQPNAPNKVVKPTVAGRLPAEQ